MGPVALPEAWNRDEKVVHYVIPKSLADWLSTKLGSTGVYTVFGIGGLALASKEILSYHAEVQALLSAFVTWSFINMAGGDAVYKAAQDQAQGQALYNQQKLTNLALMLETEYLSRQNKLVPEVSRKLNYRVAIESAHADHESAHMINWIEAEVAKELSQLDQDEQIRVCVDQLKSL